MNHKERCEVYFGMVEVVLDAMRIPWEIQMEGGLRDDLLSVGYEALVVASSKFDPSRGLQFQTYASCTIRGCIQKHMTKLRKEKAQRVPIGSISDVEITSRMEDLEGPPVEEYDWTLVDKVAPEGEANKAFYYEHILGYRSIRDISEGFGLSVKAGRKRVGRLKHKLAVTLDKEIQQ